MLKYNEIKERAYIALDGEPYEVLSSHVFRKQQRKPVNVTKLRNLKTHKVVERSFHQNERVAEADIETKDITYLYSRPPLPAKRGREYWFCEAKNPKERFKLEEPIVGDGARFLKERMTVGGIYFENDIIGVKLPIKIDVTVTDAPPGTRGNTAQGGTKHVVLETGATLAVPLFVQEGDVVRINTESGEYSERVEKK